MGLLKDLLLAWNRHGRAFSGSAAFPEPPQLEVPRELRDATDGEETEPDDTGE